MLISSIIGFYHKSYFHALLLHPYEVYRGKRIHTLLTSAFVHRNWLHLSFNLIVAYGLAYDMFGNIDQEYGLTYAYMYTPILCFLLIALPNIIQVIYKRNDFIFTAVGASGLTSGLFGFSFLFFPQQKIDHLFIPWIKNASHYWLYVLIVMLLMSFIRQTRITYSLHVVAYIIGSIIALLIRHESLIELFNSY